MKGVYIVLFELKSKKEIEVGALNNLSFEPGRYIYIGSAMNSLESRVGRHFSGNKENTHWHIDYFSAIAEPIGFAAFSVDSDWECLLSEAASKKCLAIDGFGASDCNCDAHLYKLPEKG